MSFQRGSSQLAANIRAIANNPEERAAFVSEGIQQAKELQRKSIQEYENAVASLLMCLENFNMMDGRHVEVMCELTVLDILLNLDLSAIQVSQCTSYVKLCMKVAVNPETAAAVAKTFSETLSTNTATDFVREQINEALAKIAVVQQPRATEAAVNASRLCGILVLTEVAMHIPMLLLPKLNDLLDSLWLCLATDDERVRKEALTLFTLGIKLLNNRSPTLRAEAYTSLVHKLKASLSASVLEKNVSGLLAFEPIVMGAMGCSTPPRYEDLSIILMPFMMTGKNANISPLVRQLLFHSLIVLCRYSTPLFVANQLKETVRFALLSVKRDMQRCAAFDMLSELVVLVGGKAYEPYVEETVREIADIFQTVTVPCWEALRCFSLICKTCPPHEMEAYIDHCADYVFSWGPSAQLIESMRDIISSCKAAFRIRLEESLLDMISVTLCGLPFRQQSHTRKITINRNDGDASNYQVSVALNALMQFGFSNSELMGDFLRDSVLPFIDNDSAPVRNAAIFAIVKLLIPPGEKGNLSIARRICIDTIISRMLVVSLSDPSENVRQTVLGSFTADFFPFISEPQFLHYVYATLGDEYVNCRVAGLELLCGMIDHDPSNILLMLRKEILKILHFISCSTEPEAIQTGLRLLSAAATKAPQLTSNFMDGVSVALQPHFDAVTPSAPFLLSLLNCATAVAKAAHLFSKKLINPLAQVSKVCNLFESLPSDRSYHASRLTCLRYLSATLSPRMGGELVYKTFPQLFSMLATILRNTEENTEIRLEAVRCVGAIGALDTHTFATLGIDEGNAQKTHERSSFTVLTDQMCCGIVLRAIAKLVNPTERRYAANSDTLLRTAVRTILDIGACCPSAPKEMSVVIPSVVAAISELGEGRLLCTMLYELTSIINLTGEPSLAHLDCLDQMFCKLWNSATAYRFALVHFSSAITTHGEKSSEHFGKTYAKTLPMIIDSLTAANASDFLRYSVLSYMVKHVLLLEPFTDIVVSTLLRVIRAPQYSADFIVATVTVLRDVVRRHVIPEHAGAIVRALLSCLASFLRTPLVHGTSYEAHPLFTRIMSVFNVLGALLQTEFSKYIPSIVQLLRSHQIACAEFGYMNAQLMKGLRCVISPKMHAEFNAESATLLKTCDNIIIRAMAQYGDVWSYGLASQRKSAPAVFGDQAILPIAEQRILASLRTLPVTKEEWVKSVEVFSVTVLQQSPFKVFRCVSLSIGNNATPLVERAPEVAHDLLKIAFRVLWKFGSVTLRAGMTEFLRQTLREAMRSSMVPDEVVTTILSLAEYMDNVGATMPISLTDLSECAWKRGMLAKALYWREAAFREDAEGTTQSLITLYANLRSVESALGILNMTNDEQRNVLLQSNLIKLGKYTAALELMEQDFDQQPDSQSSQESALRTSFSLRSLRSQRALLNSSDMGSAQNALDSSKMDLKLQVDARRMLCWSELGDYPSVLREWIKVFKCFGTKSVGDIENSILFYVSQYAADAALQLQSWDTLQEVIPWMPKTSVLFYISQAALNINASKFDAAIDCVWEGRRILLDDLAGLLHESYGRAYDGLIVAQQLTELEEVIEAQRRKKYTSGKEEIETVMEVWDERLQTMSRTVETWKQMLGVRGLLLPPCEDVSTRIQFTKLCRQEGENQLEKFTLEQLLGSDALSYETLMNRSLNPKVVMEYISYLSFNKKLGPGSKYGEEKDLLRKFIDLHLKAENTRLLSRAFVRLGKLLPPQDAVDCYEASTVYDPKWRIAWRLWAEANGDILNVAYEDEACQNAVTGYVKSILLSPDSLSIHDLLKLLTLWLRYADSERGLSIMRSNVMDIPARLWFPVVPQLIARLDCGSDESCELTAQILVLVADEFPQTLIYPLNLCTKSDSSRRKLWATEIIKKMQHKYANLIDQGRMLIDELIRVSALVYEVWYDGLENAATAFFGRRDCEAMVNIIKPLHEMLKKAPETLVEVEFVAKHAKALDEARVWMRSFSLSKSIADVQSAWNLYHIVYKKIDEQIKGSPVLSMHNCSPKLFEARNLAIGIPSARPKQDDDTVHISNFHDNVLVIVSKQRPKRIAITTVEGYKQKYLLKGHEDLRLDERVMQLFRLVNTLMMVDSMSSTNFGYQIQQYSVTPLTDTVGIIGWVDGCDTLHELVRSYRTYRGIPSELELRMLNQIISTDNPKAYDYLSIMSKVEVVEFLADHTSGHDIRKAMWAIATDCETWLERRNMYTTSLGTMSVVGYILGLGDRHPNNIMIQKGSGLVVHIDFGDCFEVAMTRDKFPEKVPFRLTRMVRNALEVSGVDGAFHSCMEVAINVLRNGNHSVVALLEAFIQDPLISWRLVNRPGEEPEASTDHKTMEEQITTAKLNNKGETGGVGIGSNIATMGIASQPGLNTGNTTQSPRKKVISILENSLMFTNTDDVAHKGVSVLNRLSSKLRGMEFALEEGRQESMNPRTQVNRLIAEATNITNVAQSWSGWYPFW